MASEKKITLRHFANLSLKGEESKNADGGILLKPYVEVIFRRQHIQIKSRLNTMVTENLDNLSIAEKKLLNEEIELLKKIIRYEETQWGDKHKIKGLGRRYTNYCASIFEVVDDKLRIKLKKTIRKRDEVHHKVIDFENKIIPAERLFTAATAIWPDLGDYLNLDQYQQELKLWQKYFELFSRMKSNVFRNYPAFIDWLAEDHYNEFYTLLLKENDISENVVEECLNDVNTTIRLATIDQ